MRPAYLVIVLGLLGAVWHDACQSSQSESYVLKYVKPSQWSTVSSAVSTRGLCSSGHVVSRASTGLTTMLGGVPGKVMDATNQVEDYLEDLLENVNDKLAGDSPVSRGTSRVNNMLQQVREYADAGAGKVTDGLVAVEAQLEVLLEKVKDAAPDWTSYVDEANKKLTSLVDDVTDGVKGLDSKVDAKVDQLKPNTRSYVQQVRDWLLAKVAFLAAAVHSYAAGVRKWILG